MEYGSSMNRNLWYGFLEAGDKSSPVVIDIGLTTDNVDTVYVFNQNRNKILEYKREIIDSKLRELNTSETELIKVLTAAYEQVLETFLPKSVKTPAVNYGEGHTATVSKAHTEDEAIREDDYQDYGDFEEEREEEDIN